MGELFHNEQDCSLAQLEAPRQVAAPVGEDLVLTRKLVRVAEARVALLRHDLQRGCRNIYRGVWRCKEVVVAKLGARSRCCGGTFSCTAESK